jgi:uncharacterized protein YqgC (DUF456 family)
MTKAETVRESEQARVADIVAQTMQLKLQGAAALAVIGTFAGVIIVAIAVSQAKEVVQPVSDMALKNETNIKNLTREIQKGQAEILSILKSSLKK